VCRSVDHQVTCHLMIGVEHGLLQKVSDTAGVELLEDVTPFCDY